MHNQAKEHYVYVQKRVSCGAKGGNHAKVVVNVVIYAKSRSTAIVLLSQAHHSDLQGGRSGRIDF